jgi:Ca-activated chloride channel family protein
VEANGVIAFGQPSFLALLLVVLAMAGAGAWLARWRRRARERFAGAQAARWPPSPFGQRLSLVLLAAGLIAFAAARPQWGHAELRRERSGVDLVLVLDISQSMQADDVSPARLAVAQRELTRLAESQRGSRIGLVLFAGSAIMRSPLTTDTLALSQLIARAGGEAGLTRAGSDIGGALDVADRVLAASEAPGKAIVLVSDGEDHAGTFAEKARALREKGISVYAAGVGTLGGAALSDIDPRTGQPRPKLDAQGRPVVSRLTEGTLRAVAEQGGGRYVPIQQSGDLLSLRDDLARLEQTPIGEELQSVPMERFQLFAAAALALLVVSWFLPAQIPLPHLRRPRRLRPAPALALMALTLIVGACSGESLRSRNGDANSLFEKGDYEGALAAYQKLIAERPDVPELSYNAGNALHRLGNYRRAVQETLRALPPTQAKLGARTYYALGNHLLALGSLDEAYEAYRAALLLDPTDEDAKYNLEVTLLQIVAAQQAESNGEPPSDEPPQGGPAANPEDEGAPGAPGDESAVPDATPSAASPAQPRTLEEALRGIDAELTVEEALNILDLLREQQRQARPPPGSGATGPDY